MSWWNQSEEHFPADRHKVEHSVHSFNILNFTIVTFSWVKHASSDELGAPGLLLLLIKPRNQLCVRICLLLLFHIGHNINNLQRFFTKLSAFWVNILELESESIVTVTAMIIFVRLWQDFDPDALLSFLIQKD